MSVNLHVLLRNTLFCLIALYFAQGPFYGTGSIIAKLALMAVLLISAFYCLKSFALKGQKPEVYYALFMLLTLNGVGFVINGVYSGIYFGQLRNILTALLPFYSFYYLARKGYLSEKNLVAFFLIMLPIIIAKFYHSQSTMLLNRDSNDENVVTNVAYLFVYLMPLAFFWGKHKVMAVLSVLVLMFFIAQGAKRGAVITGVAGMVIFAYYQLKYVPPNKKMQSYGIAFLGVVLISIFTLHFIETNEYLMRRMAAISDGGSGRDRIYTNLISAWTDSDNIFRYFFGFGFVATIQNSGTGNLAHNDWLELLINFGLIGVFVYMLVFLGVARFILSKENSKEHRMIMLAIAVIWFLQTLFSMYYNASGTAITMVALGYLIGKEASKPKCLNVGRVKYA